MQMPRDEALQAGLVTVHESANHRLWSEMSKVGWMAEVIGLAQPVNKEAMLLVQTICFRLTPAGLDRVPIFLQTV